MSAPNAPTVDATTSWEPFLDGVRAFVARRVSADDADDVAQEVFLRLARGGDAPNVRDHVRNYGAWVFGVTRRTIADHYRRAHRAGRAEPLLDEPDAVPDASPSRAEVDAHEEVLSWLRPMADELPAGYRDALVLADFEGVPQREVAERLGVGLSGAKSRIQRARRMLGESLRRCCTVELDADGKAVAWSRRAASDCRDGCECS